MLFCVAGVAFRDILMGLRKCRKASCATGAMPLQGFQKMGQHFGDFHRHFAWHAQHFRCVVLRPFCDSHCQGCVKS